MTSYLIEAEEKQPSDEDPPVAIARPPRPEHRRVYTSLVFTTAILVGTVVAVYLAFPARHHVFATSVAAEHRAATPAWELVAPSPAELRAWTIGVVGASAPLPPRLDATTAVGAESLVVLSRRVALVRLRHGADDLTYAVSRGHGVSPRSSRTDGPLRIIEWRTGPWAVVAIGPDATSASWKPILGAP